MTLKLVFDPETGKILGAQADGGAGVDKRIDVIAMAIQAGMTVYDLEEAELAYARSSARPRTRSTWRGSWLADCCEAIIRRSTWKRLSASSNRSGVTH